MKDTKYSSDHWTLYKENKDWWLYNIFDITEIILPADVVENILPQWKNLTDDLSGREDIDDMLSVIWLTYRDITRGERRIMARDQTLPPGLAFLAS